MGDDYEGLTLDELEQLADAVFTRLSVKTEDGEALADAYTLSRAALELVRQHRQALNDIEILKARLELLRKAPRP